MNFSTGFQPWISQYTQRPATQSPPVNFGGKFRNTALAAATCALSLLAGVTSGAKASDSVEIEMSKGIARIHCETDSSLGKDKPNFDKEACIEKEAARLLLDWAKRGI